MDFIPSLPKYEEKNVIMVAVNQLNSQLIIIGCDRG